TRITRLRLWLRRLLRLLLLARALPFDGDFAAEAVATPATTAADAAILPTLLTRSTLRGGGTLGLRRGLWRGLGHHDRCLGLVTILAFALGLLGGGLLRGHRRAILTAATTAAAAAAAALALAI